MPRRPRRPDAPATPAPGDALAAQPAPAAPSTPTPDPGAPLPPPRRPARPRRSAAERRAALRRLYRRAWLLGAAVALHWLALVALGLALLPPQAWASTRANLPALPLIWAAILGASFAPALAQESSRRLRWLALVALAWLDAFMLSLETPPFAHPLLEALRWTLQKSLVGLVPILLSLVVVMRGYRFLIDESEGLKPPAERARDREDWPSYFR